MKNLTVKRAYSYLLESSNYNPGKWIDHSKYVGLAAKNIAPHINLNPLQAEAYGYVHDIGRRFGAMKMEHIIKGYKFMTSEGYPDAARICLTHSFPVFKAESIPCWDCSKKEYVSVKKYLKNTQPTKMDRLIQLCDVLAMAEGFVTIDRRLVDTTLRYNIDKNTLNRWRGYLQIQADFEQEIGYSIYKLLPGIEHNMINSMIKDVITF